MVSSALYRYFPSRDELLTALIVDAYDSVGAAAEEADARALAAGHPPRARWIAVCEAVRAWALEHPHEYALIYGSPVPGYSAPSTPSVPPPASGTPSSPSSAPRTRAAASHCRRCRPPCAPRPSG